MTSDSWKQLQVFVCLALLLSGFATVITVFATDSFVRFFGTFNPILVCLLAFALGGLSLVYLNALQGFSVLVDKRRMRGLVWAALAAAVFGLIIVAIDIVDPLPEDINVGFPISLLFYPVMALLVESVFHLAPMAAVLFLIGFFTSTVPGRRRVLFAMGLVALLEPLYQLSLMVAGNETGAMAIAIFVHILAINLTQLYIFRRFDFVSMFAFRIFYYLIWHIIWGYLRLL